MSAPLPDHCVDPACKWCRERRARKARQLREERARAGLPMEDPAGDAIEPEND